MKKQKYFINLLIENHFFVRTSESVGKSQLSLTLPAPLPIPLVVDVIEEADGGGVMGGGGGVVEAEALLLPAVPLSSELRSKVTRRTAPTRSLAMRDQDSMRLWASQQAAGPRPLIFAQQSVFRAKKEKKGKKPSGIKYNLPLILVFANN